jgi:hypothetical protein
LFSTPSASEAKAASRAIPPQIRDELKKNRARRRQDRMVRAGKPGSDSNGREGLWTSIRGDHHAADSGKTPINSL